MTHPPCGTAQILLKRGCAATSLCCAPSAGYSQVARSRHHHSHRLGGGMMVHPLSPPPGQFWPGQAVPFRRSSGRHGAAPLPPPLPVRHPGERIISVHHKIAGRVVPRECPRLLLSQPRPPLHDSRSRHLTWQGELRRLAATQLILACAVVPVADRSGGRAWRHAIGSG